MDRRRRVGTSVEEGKDGRGKGWSKENVGEKE